VPEPTLTVLALLALAGLTAGYVDAVVGGGGLVQLPALLLGLPDASPVQILATNKLASICGTTVSSVTYYRRVRPDPRTFLPLMLLAFVGSVLGAGLDGSWTVFPYSGPPADRRAPHPPTSVPGPARRRVDADAARPGSPGVLQQAGELSLVARRCADAGPHIS
jgi:hypothetical protein